MNKRAETDRKTDYFPSSLTLRGGGGARGEVQDKVSVEEAGGRTIGRVQIPFEGGPTPPRSTIRQYLR